MNLCLPVFFRHFFAVIYLGLVLFMLLAQGTAQADEGSLVPENYSLMGFLEQQGWHDRQNERWNAYGQATYISSWKPAFAAAYTNLNGSPHSLSPQAERSFTGTVTAYFGLRAWQGAEIYLAPEMISELPLSDLKGLGGGIQNFELQKTGAVSATWYKSRFFLKQSFDFGQQSHQQNSGPMQLAGPIADHRLVFTVGNLSVLDVFDKNAYAGDLRQQFFNMAFLTHAAYDFAADARGYSVGAALEYYWQDWAVRLGRFASPQNPNDLPLDFRLFKYYGDQFELEHRHKLADQPGAIRLLAYRNHEHMASWQDAIAAYQLDPTHNAAACTSYAYDSANSTAPDLCWARKANVKMGIGINWEQSLTDSIGLFLRAMYADGKTEVYSYTSSDRSLSFGTLITGKSWGRQQDVLGLAYASSWLSNSHVQYLNMGGVDGFIGDGKISYAAEQVVDLYYKYQPFKSVWLTADYQHIANPANNADRGPVNVYGLRAHFEF